MGLRPFSDHRRGLFISIDGPSGAGKPTIVAHLANLLVADGEQVHVTAEPSEGVIGKLARQVTEAVTGPALACLYAADRYHHIETEIRPRTKAGEIVITDRYVPSGLVIQRFDGVDNSPRRPNESTKPANPHPRHHNPPRRSVAGRHEISSGRLRGPAFNRITCLARFLVVASRSDSGHYYLSQLVHLLGPLIESTGPPQ